MTRSIFLLSAISIFGERGVSFACTFLPFAYNHLDQHMSSWCGAPGGRGELSTSIWRSYLGHLPGPFFTKRPWWCLDLFSVFGGVLIFSQYICALPPF